MPYSPPRARSLPSPLSLHPDYSPSIHSVTYVTRGAAAPIVTPSPLAQPDAMDGLTILSDVEAWRIVQVLR